MKFQLDQAIPVLERTPVVLKELLQDLDENWIMNNEGPDTFSPFDVVGHLVHGEKTDWMVRVKVILTEGTSRAFEPYNRFAQHEESKGKNLQQLISEFGELRGDNLRQLRLLNLQQSDLDKKGLHPVLGEVTLQNLLATWVVHDLTHIAQVTRVMAKQYKTEIGPWPEFFRILSF